MPWSNQHIGMMKRVEVHASFLLSINLCSECENCILSATEGLSSSLKEKKTIVS